MRVIDAVAEHEKAFQKEKETQPQPHDFLKMKQKKKVQMSCNNVMQFKSF